MNIFEFKDKISFLKDNPEYLHSADDFDLFNILAGQNVTIKEK